VSRSGLVDLVVAVALLVVLTWLALNVFPAVQR